MISYFLSSTCFCVCLTLQIEHRGRHYSEYMHHCDFESITGSDDELARTFKVIILLASNLFYALKTFTIPLTDCVRASGIKACRFCAYQPVVSVAPGTPETHRRRFHSLNKVVFMHLLAACLTMFTALLVSPDTTLANPPTICAAPKWTLESNQGIQGVSTACISNHTTDLLIQGNRFLPRP